MPRTKPVYKWTTSTDSPTKKELQGSSQYHRVKGKLGKTYRTDTIPVSLSTKDSAFVKNVHFGSHKNIDALIGEEMRRIGL